VHIDARQLGNNSTIEGDICIIGAGAAGLSIALEWLNTPYKVILLEGGGFEYDDKVQDLLRGKETGQKYYPLKSTRLHLFGGSTGHWGGMCSTFDPIAFQKRDWVPLSGWPITQEELMPFYMRSANCLELPDTEFDVNAWTKKDSTLVPLPFQKYFWNKVWRFSKPTRFGSRYKDTMVNASNIHLYTYANATEIHTNENVSSVSGVTIKNYAGKTHKVIAKHYILACCAIQNARLLLASNKQAPGGLGNDNDLVGRHFMEHCEIHAGELWLNDANALKLYMYKPPRAKAELAVKAEKQAEFQILNGITSFSPLDLDKKIPPLSKSWSTDDPRENWKDISDADVKARGNKIKRFFESKEHQSWELVVRLEQAPNPNSRIYLDKELDTLGVPRPILHWELGDFEKRTLRKIIELIGKEAGLSGIGRVKLDKNLWDEKNIEFPENTSGGWHHMGTTRMDNDPKRGVTDGNGKIHGINNLYTTGSSNFTTGGGVNPTMTLIALSIRLSDHVKDKLKKGTV